MSETTLTSLLEYLYGTLTPSNQRWVAEHLKQHADQEEKALLKPYTMEELDARLDQSERDFAEGHYHTHEDVLKMLDEEYAHSKAERRKQALKKDMTPEQLYSLIAEEIDEIYANG